MGGDGAALARDVRSRPSGNGLVTVGEKLFRFLARLILEKSYGSVTIKFESGKMTHVETETRRAWQYKDLPDTVQSPRPRSENVGGGK